MSDIINRQDAVDAVLDLSEKMKNEMLFIDAIVDEIENLPSVELERKKGTKNTPSLEGVTGVIRCENCKWWDRLEDGHPYGDCRACRSGTHTERWNIHIQRQCKFDFYCADAEPKEEDDNDE